MDIYTEDVLDHYEHPRNQGELSGEGVVSVKQMNSSCGDLIEFFVKVERGKIVDAKWRGGGCAISMASASKLSEWIKGRKVEVIKKMSEEELAKLGIGFEVNPGRRKCLQLPVVVVRKLATHTTKS